MTSPNESRPPNFTESTDSTTAGVRRGSLPRATTGRELSASTSGALAHAMVRNSCPNAPREGTLDMLMSRSSAVKARLGNVEGVSIDYMEASGDCFYLALEAALSEQEGWQPYYAVAHQRDVVASSMSEETYQLYSLLHKQQAEGFKFMHGVADVESLRKRVRLRGAKVRPPSLPAFAAARTWAVPLRPALPPRPSRPTAQPASPHACTAPPRTGRRGQVRLGRWVCDGDDRQPLPAPAPYCRRALLFGTALHAHRARQRQRRGWTARAPPA